MSTAERISFEFKDESEIRSDSLESIEFAMDDQMQARERQYIKHSTDEFTAVCPYSGLPNLGTVLIQYFPNNTIVELKSLKYYLVSYRSVGILQQAATDKIFKDLWRLLDPLALSVMTIYKVRGGIESTCRIEKHAKGQQQLLHEFES